MRSAPGPVIEKIVTLLIPPACREEVLGDLYERCDSSEQYFREALRVAPMVLFSRIRRTADSQVLILQLIAVYLSFLTAAWHEGKTFLFEDSGLLRLAVPPAWVLFGLIIDDAYAVPGKRSLHKQMRGPVLGLGLAYLSQMVLSADNRGLGLPFSVMLFGSAVGLLFSMALRYLFPPIVDRPAGAGGPALWLKWTPEPLRIADEAMSIAKTLVLVLGLAVLGGQVGGRLLALTLVLVSVVVLIFRELRKTR